jgi:hypothetical protein
MIAVHLVAGAALLTLAYGFATTAAWTGTSNYLMLGLGILLAPLVARGEQARSGANPFWSHDLYAW